MLYTRESFTTFFKANGKVNKSNMNFEKVRTLAAKNVITVTK